MVITEEQVQGVKKHYMTKYPEMCKLAKQYEKEKVRAKVYHKLKSFPSISEWVPRNGELSDLQREMCCGPSNKGKS